VRNGSNDLRGIGELLSEPDRGDTYTFQPVAGTRTISGRWSAARTVWKGPIVASIARQVAIGGRVSATVYAQVNAGSNLLRLTVAGVNRAGNQRVRMRFPLPSDVSDGRSVADMQYGPVTRERRSYDLTQFRREWPVLTALAHRYVSVGNRKGGMTVFARGPFEYELVDHAILVTLFRSVDQLSRGDLAARPGHAAWPVSTPDAQEIGPFRLDFGLAFQGIQEDQSPEEWDAIERLAEEFHAPPAGLMLRYGIDVPERIRGPELRGAGLAFKALKSAEAGEAVMVRCVNLTTKAVNGTWTWPDPVARAVRARLDETEIAELSVVNHGREIRFVAAAREVVTIIVTPAG